MLAGLRRRPSASMPSGPARLASVTERLPLGHAPILEHDVVARHAGRQHELLAHGHAGVVERRAGAARPERSARPRRHREVRVAEFRANPVGSDAEQFCGDLGQDRVGPRPDVRHGRARGRPRRPDRCRPRPWPAAEGCRGSPPPRPCRPASCRPARSRRRLPLVPAEQFGALAQAGHHGAGGVWHVLRRIDGRVVDGRAGRSGPCRASRPARPWRIRSPACRPPRPAPASRRRPERRAPPAGARWRCWACA